jgi:hypothetical protein
LKAAKAEPCQSCGDATTPVAAPCSLYLAQQQSRTWLSPPHLLPSTTLQSHRLNSRVSCTQRKTGTLSPKKSARGWTLTSQWGLRTPPLDGRVSNWSGLSCRTARVPRDSGTAPRKSLPSKQPTTRQRVLASRSQPYAHPVSSRFFGLEVQHSNSWAGHPPVTFGPPLHSVKSLDSLNASSAGVYGLMKKDGTSVQDGIPDTAFPVFTDVRNLAQAHYEAVARNKAGRFVCCGGVSAKSVRV